MRAGVARTRVAAAVAEGVELLHVADRQSGLSLDPGPQPDLEGAVRQRIERPERKPRARPAHVPVARVRLALPRPASQRRAFRRRDFARLDAARLGLGALAGDENGRLLAFHGYDRGGEPDLDRRARGVGHGGIVPSNSAVMPAKAGIR